MAEKNTDQNTPKPVRLARLALSQLAAEGTEVSKPLSKALTAYALMLDKNGQDIDTEHLLHAARQGKNFLKQHTSVPQKQQQKKDYFKTYLDITQNLPIIRFRGTDEYLLNRYIRTGDMEKFELRLKNPDCTPTERDAAIYMAARKGSVECFNKLIRSGAKLRAVDDLPIKYALQGDHIPMVKALITHKLSVSDPHIVKDTLRSSYYKAVENGNEEIVNLIESHIPKQDLPKIQENALHAAACSGHTHLWQRLAQETTITEPAKLISSLLQAANAGYFETVKTICDTYADANLSFGMCLNAATKENHADIVDYLLPKIDKNDISYVMAALRNAIASAGNVNMAQKLYNYIEDALENRDNRYSKDDLIRHKKAFQREIGKISLTTPIENEYLETIVFFIHLKNEVPADAFPQAIRLESFKTAEYLYNLKYNPDHNSPIKLRGDFNIDDVEYLKDYCIKKQQWLNTIHQIPPHGLHDENPAFFKKRCFENIQKIIRHEGYHNKTANALAFQATALFQSEDRVLQYLEKWGRSSEQPLHNLVQMIKVPKEGNPNLKDWGDAVLKCGPTMAKLVKFADRLPSPLKSTDGKTWSMTATRDEVAQYSFQKANAHPKLAALCLELNMDEDEFETALKLIQTTRLPDKKDIPTLHVDGADFDAK